MVSRRPRTSLARTLEGLPASWRVFAEVRLDHDHVDFVVIGPGGVFALLDGERHGEGTFDLAARCAAQLSGRLGVDVQPLVVGGTDARAHSVDELLPYLLGQAEAGIDYATGRRIVGDLASLAQVGRSGMARGSERAEGTEEDPAETLTRQILAHPFARKVRRLSIALQLAWLAVLLTVIGVGLHLLIRVVNGFYADLLAL